MLNTLLHSITAILLVPAYTLKSSRHYCSKQACRATVQSLLPNDCLLYSTYPLTLMLRHLSSYLFPGFSFVQWKAALCQLWVQVLMYGWSKAGILTQVCVIGFAELLLSTEAELELRLVRPAQGVSILKGSEGITSVAVGDKAKIVPGIGNRKWSMKYTEDIS